MSLPRRKCLSIKILVDESVNFSIVKLLRGNNLEVISVSEKYSGVPDEEVLKLARENSALLLTEDKDFGKWVFAHKEKVSSVIFLRYKMGDLNKIIQALNKVLMNPQTLSNRFIVVTAKKIRFRDII